MRALLLTILFVFNFNNLMAQDVFIGPPVIQPLGPVVQGPVAPLGSPYVYNPDYLMQQGLQYGGDPYLNNQQVRSIFGDIFKKHGLDDFMHGRIPKAIDRQVSAKKNENCPPDGRTAQEIEADYQEEVRRAIEEAQRLAEEAKRELEESMPETSMFEDLDAYFVSLTDEPPPQCGYKLRGFSTAQVNAICKAMSDVVNDQPVSCHFSNCTTASFLGIIKILKQRPDFESMKSDYDCRRPWPAAYRDYINGNLRGLVLENDLGEFKIMRVSGSAANRSNQLKTQLEQGFPKKGYPMLLDRLNRTGHAVIFSHYETVDGSDYVPGSDAQIKKVCYWSSNQSTRGSANRCEDISNMASLHTADITGA